MSGEHGDWFLYFSEHIVLPCSHCAFYLYNSGAAEITMVEAVEYLSKREDTFQHCGASYIQHRTFIDDKAKEEVVCLVVKNSTSLSTCTMTVNTLVSTYTQGCAGFWI